MCKLKAVYYWWPNCAARDAACGHLRQEIDAANGCLPQEGMLPLEIYFRDGMLPVDVYFRNGMLPSESSSMKFAISCAMTAPSSTSVQGRHMQSTGARVTTSGEIPVINMQWLQYY